ncbi:MAG: hypothetical protein ABI977_02950 [Acidobacteriota bacterium]
MLEHNSLLLALASLPPLLLSAIGLFLIARMLKRKNGLIGELAYIGATLIVAGQAMQALWRLLRAASGHDYHWLYNGLLVLVVPGSVCLAWALWKGLRDGIAGMTAGQVWLLPLSLNAGLLALTAASRVVLGGRAWFVILSIAATLAAIAASLLLTRRAIHHRLSFAAMLFLIALVMPLVLARMTGQGMATQAAEWTRQISNIISQAAFAFAAFQLATQETGAVRE